MTTVIRTYEEIAVPLDFSADGWRVVPVAEHLAHAFAVPIRFIHVDTSSPWSDADPPVLRLHHLCAQQPMQVQVVADRDVALGLARAVTDKQSLVVMAAHARVPAADVFLQSHLESVVRSVDGPVVVGGPRLAAERPKLSRIVMCVDADAPPVELIEDVATWSRALSMPVEVLTVLPDTHGDVEESIPEQQVRVGLLAEQLGDAGVVSKSVVLRGARPGHEIVRYVNVWPGTVVALATHARTLPARALLGSVALKVIRQATGPVLLRRRNTTH